MAKIDLHVHSKHSGHPSDWFLKRLGTNESYTELDFIYRLAKERGMDFVAVTDHNTMDGALYLRDRYPEETIPGVEVTTYFPEDGCKIHILIYGIDQSEFHEIEKIRGNIYNLRDYIKENNLAHSVAHATYSVNKKLTIEHLEKLILLFDTFEVINGSRNQTSNTTWMDVLKHLRPSQVDTLHEKYRIEPFSAAPWFKGVTGGSDDHAGLFIGKTYTVMKADSPAEVIVRLKEKSATVGGRHNDSRGLAFALYKITYDFSKSQSPESSRSLLSQVNGLLFEKKSLKLRDKIKFRLTNKRNNINNLLHDLIGCLSNSSLVSIDERFNMLYDKIAEVADRFFINLIKSMESDIRKGDLVNFLKSASSSLLGIFLTIPFFSTLHHMNAGREIITSLKNRYLAGPHPQKKRILWFTDTLSNLNGVSVTLRQIGWNAHFQGRELTLVTSLMDEEIDAGLPPNVMNLPHIYEYKLPYYEQMVLKIPSILKSLERLQEIEPDEIYISSPGPMGLLGLLAARLLNVKTIGVYHTDFTLQAEQITGETTVAQIVETGMRWFYSLMDEIAVPSREYMNILEQRGYDRERMTLFRRAIDPVQFSQHKHDGKCLRKRFLIRDGYHLLYAGRISKDKNLDFLMDVYKKTVQKRDNVNLLVVGDGPYLSELKEKMARYPRVIFTGRLDNSLLPDIYSMAQLLLFPSTTDTFGMAVLEAQSCGVPAIVSNHGGPQEIIINGQTGFVVDVSSVQAWSERIDHVLQMIESDPGKYYQIRARARENIAANSSWEHFLSDLFGDLPNAPKDLPPERRQRFSAPAIQSKRIGASSIFMEPGPAGETFV